MKTQKKKKSGQSSIESPRIYKIIQKDKQAIVRADSQLNRARSAIKLADQSSSYNWPFQESEKCGMTTQKLRVFQKQEGFRRGTYTGYQEAEEIFPHFQTAIQRGLKSITNASVKKVEFQGGLASLNSKRFYSLNQRIRIHKQFWLAQQYSAMI
ncbi:hypothetical protein FGO68_gene13220 [Halteria grandinella]|uniref:Uncharacterized protein n=1 Tax=Halteria grandinella TaxID=5974 RepID=A0A8J8SVS1_HALGN|nr:hypothetical protein FGO68_gene13220 [Halteria grandinella]